MPGSATDIHPHPRPTSRVRRRRRLRTSCGQNPAKWHRGGARISPETASDLVFLFVALAYRHSHRNDLARRWQRLEAEAAATRSPKPRAHAGTRPKLLQLRLTPSQIASIVAEYKAGAHCTDLAAKHQIAKASVLKILDEQGVPKRRQSLTDEQTDEAVRRYAAGQSLARVAAALDTGATTINRALVARGVRIRGRHER